MSYQSSIFDQWVDPGTSPQEIIDGGKDHLAQNINDLCNDRSFMQDSGYKNDYVEPDAQRDIVQCIWDEAISRVNDG